MADPFEASVGTERVRPGGGETLDGVPVSTIVSPRSPEEVAACLAEAAAHGAAVVPSGGRSKLAWGNVCAAESVVRLDLGEMEGPLEIQPEEGIATVGASVRVDELERAASAHGMRTLLETSFASATVGGTIACDPVGIDAAPDRRLRNDLLGLEVALPNGTLTRCGGRVVKNVTGFDLVRLYCGSLGTLGIVTSATLRVRPLPEEQRVLARTAASLEDALAVASELSGERVEPQGAAVVPEGRAARLLWLVAGGGDDVAARAERVAGEPVPLEQWSELRSRIAGAGAGAVRGIAGTASRGVRLRVAARSSDTLELCQSLVSLAGESCLVAALPRAGIALAEISEDALPGILERCAEQRWLLFVERAPPEVKARLDVFGPEHESLPLMRALKQRFDPDGVLSPGRFVGRI